MEYVKKVYPYLFVETSYPEAHPLFHRTLMPLKVDGCNAAGAWSFSDATVEVSTEKTTGLAEFWAFRGAVQTILRSRTCMDTLTTEQKEAIDLLGFYLQNESHKKCLHNLLGKKSQDRKESEIQAVLALHLFSPLVANPELLVDRKCDEKCSLCGKQVNKGDTSFGNSLVWHGHGDILIRRCKVKIARHITEDSCCSEPLPKKLRTDSEASTSDDDDSDGSCTSVVDRDHYMPLGPLKLQKGVHCKDLSQILAQTIVNSFIQNKNCPALTEHFVPCFLASENYITIHMYNPKYDLLLTQGETMSIFSEDKLDNDTILTVWFALNFDKFPASMKDESDEEKCQKYCGKTSGFQNFISTCMDMYRKKMDAPMVVRENAMLYTANHRNSAFMIFLKEFWDREVKSLSFHYRDSASDD